MDIDIDLPTAFKPMTVFPHWTRASMVRDGQLAPHPCGVYAQDVPTDALTQLCAIPFDDAEALGYLKIDFLHLGVYDSFASRKELDEFMCREPDWGLLLIPSEQKKLFQLSKHGDVLDLVKPKSILDLADVLALIRPGKRQLLDLYMKLKLHTRRSLYTKDANGYAFKKSHAIAYAMVIKLQLLLIEDGRL